jgi:hypothetical protein
MGGETVEKRQTAATANDGFHAIVVLYFSVHDDDDDL